MAIGTVCEQRAMLVTLIAIPEKGHRRCAALGPGLLYRRGGRRRCNRRRRRSGRLLGGGGLGYLVRATATRHQDGAGKERDGSQKPKAGRRIGHGVTPMS